MRRGGICAALLLIVTSPEHHHALAAMPSDPFGIDRAGAERRAAEASLPVAFRIEPLNEDEGVACPRWRGMTLVRASRDPIWQLIRSTETDGDLEVIHYGSPGRTTLVVVECLGRPGYSLHGPRVWEHRDATETIHFRRRRTVRVNGNRKPHICGNRKLHTSGEDVLGGADILPVMPVGRVGLDAGSGATGVLANTRREAAEPAVTWRLPHAVRPTLSSASADAPASGSCCPGC